MEHKSKIKKEKYTNFSIRLPIDLIEQIEEQAAKENRSRNNMIEQLLKAELDKTADTQELK